MRTIKFRGKSLLNKKWIYGCLIKHNSIVSKTSIVTESIADYRDCFVIDNTVGQFTGLYDNNGNEIYEGDIICGKYPKVYHVIEWYEEEATFCASLIQELKYKDMYSTLKKSWIKEFKKEVIGNIHDNPELLKQQEHK